MVRKALAEPPSQMMFGSNSEIVMDGRGSTGVIQFHAPVVFETALK